MQNWIKPNMALRGIHFFSFVRANRFREKRKEEKRRREEKEEKKKGRKEVQGEEEIRYGYVWNFSLELCMQCMDTCLEV